MTPDQKVALWIGAILFVVFLFAGTAIGANRHERKISDRADRAYREVKARTAQAQLKNDAEKNTNLYQCGACGESVWNGKKKPVKCTKCKAQYRMKRIIQSS